MSFPKYPEYKDTEIEWLGEIPAHWTIEPFCARFSERRESNRGMVEDNLLSLSYGRIVKRSIESLDGLLPESFETYQIVYPDDLVFRLTDLQNDKRSLRSSIVNEKGIITSAYLAVKSSSSDPKFSHHMFRVYDLLKVFYSMGGGLRQSMKYSDLRRLPVLNPPLHEQRKIAAFLDHETARIDALIDEQKRLIKLLKEKCQALVLSAMEDPETPYIRMEYAVEVTKRPVCQKGGETYTPLGLYNRGRGLFHKDPRGKSDMGDSEFFWVKAGDFIVSGQFAWEGAVALASESEDGCVVSHRFPIVNGTKGIINNATLHSLLTTDFGSMLLNENSRGAAGRNRPLNINALMKEKIPVPSSCVQQKLNYLLHEERRILSEINAQAYLLRERRSALVSAAVTGKIDVRDWQPPAASSNAEQSATEGAPA